MIRHFVLGSPRTNSSNKLHSWVNKYLTFSTSEESESQFLRQPVNRVARKICLKSRNIQKKMGKYVILGFQN